LPRGWKHGNSPHPAKCLPNSTRIEIYGGVALQRKKHLLGSIAAAALAAGVLGTTVKPASATPATLGFYPATDIYPKGNFHLDVDTYGRATKMDGVTSYGLTYGIGPERNGILGRSEVGVDYINTLGGSVPTNSDGNTLSGRKRLLYNAKTQLYNNDKSGVRLVAGFWNVGSDDIFAPNIGYLLGSKAFKWGRVHVGVAHAFDKSNVTVTEDDDDTTYLQLGYDRMLTKKVQFAVDYYSGKSFVSGVQPTLYYYVNDKASFGLGLMHFSSKHVAPRNQVYLCFDYNFGGGGSSEPAPPATPAATPTDNKGAEPGTPATP
jgi:hypothetical protein